VPTANIAQRKSAMTYSLIACPEQAVRVERACPTQRPATDNLSIFPPLPRYIAQRLGALAVTFLDLAAVHLNAEYTGERYEENKQDILGHALAVFISGQCP